MISGKSVIAIIPARGGSKRVPNKNLLPYKGTPLVQLAINHAIGSKYIDEIVLSSDSEEILKFAQPPVIPLPRPDYLASDFATSEAVIAHALYSETVPFLPDLLVLLQPTTPNRTCSDIDSCLELALTHDQVISTYQGARNGAVYVSSVPFFLSTLSLDFRMCSESYPMPIERSLDIDIRTDFDL